MVLVSGGEPLGSEGTGFLHLCVQSLWSLWLFITCCFSVPSHLPICRTLSRFDRGQTVAFHTLEWTTSVTCRGAKPVWLGRIHHWVSLPWQSEFMLTLYCTRLDGPDGLLYTYVRIITYYNWQNTRTLNIWILLFVLLFVCNNNYIIYTL